MFCAFCGNSNPDNAGYCHPLRTTTASFASSSVPNGLKNETKVVEVSSGMEEQTIREYNCFGWALADNREVTANLGSVSKTVRTYVKLTFTRDRSMPNFPILDQLYQQYWEAQAKYRQLENEIQETVDKITTRTAIISCICSFSIVFAIFFRLYGFGIFTFLYALMGGGAGAGLGALLGAGIGIVGKRLKHKKYAPVLAELLAMRSDIAQKAARYL